MTMPSPTGTRIQSRSSTGPRPVSGAYTSDQRHTAPPATLLGTLALCVSPIPTDLRPGRSKTDLNHQTLKASKALLSHISKAAQEADATASKRNILTDGADDDELAAETPIWLNLTTKRHISDDARLKPGKIRLPHSLNDDEQTTICLITADPQRAYKNILADDEFPVELSKRITRVIDVTKLKAKYSRYEAQRKLFADHDVFLADDRIVNRLPKILGKTFFKTTQKRPVPVVISAKQPKGGKKKAAPRPKKTKAEGEINAGKPADIAKEIEKALSSALIALSPSTNTAIKVAYAGMTAEQVAANVEAVATGVVEKWVPQKWRNVKAIHIKGPNTVALPIWLTDELWLEQTDVVANDDPKSLQAASQKANVGKKRKSIGDATEEEEAPKPSKKAKSKSAPAPEGNDDKLDAQIADRKARLRKQKASASKNMD
ncbi:ribosomal protein L1 [Sarocladium strictum]